MLYMGMHFVFPLNLTTLISEVSTQTYVTLCHAHREAWLRVWMAPGLVPTAGKVQAASLLCPRRSLPPGCPPG